MVDSNRPGHNYDIYLVLVYIPCTSPSNGISHWLVESSGGHSKYILTKIHTNTYYLTVSLQTTLTHDQPFHSMLTKTTGTSRMATTVMRGCQSTQSNLRPWVGVRQRCRRQQQSSGFQHICWLKIFSDQISPPPQQYDHTPRSLFQLPHL